LSYCKLSNDSLDKRLTKREGSGLKEGANTVLEGKTMLREME